MIERGEHLRFALEAREPIGIVRERFGQDLQRDVAIRASCRARDRPRPCRLRRAPMDFVRTEPRAGPDHRFRPLNRTMSFVVMERAIARRLPSRDHANPVIVRPSLKWVSWRGGPPSGDWVHQVELRGVHISDGSAAGHPVRQAPEVRGGAIGRGAQSGSSHTSSGTPPRPSREANRSVVPFGATSGALANTGLSCLGAPPASGTVAAFGISGGCTRQHLERNEPIQPRIANSIDLSHTARAEDSKDFIRAEARAGREYHAEGTG